MSALEYYLKRLAQYCKRLDGVFPLWPYIDNCWRYIEKRTKSNFVVLR